MRVGIGYDAHRLERGHPLKLGGVLIPFPYGLEGHSDGDALLHAIIDALLGACGKNDIGHHFPSTDPQYSNIASIHLLGIVVADIIPLWKVVNLDATILAQEPKLSPFIPAMKTIIASSLLVEESQINIKATTTDGLDAFGAGEGIGAQAIALLEECQSG
jgi:2-C-methyl-D-erythritol 2,4-cyclodiphosphate synthase